MKRAALALALVACNTTDVVVGGLQEVAVLPAVPDRDLDLLLVVDNSPSMADKQRALAAALPSYLDQLARLDGGMPSLHVGVVTTDLGTLGSAVAEPGPSIGTVGRGACAGRGDDGALRQLSGLPDPFLVDIDQSGSRARNYTGELTDLLAQLVQPGEAGCGFEQPLSALRRALVNPTNAAMFRPDANLAVVIITDEDDCSFLDPALLAADADGSATSFRCFEHGVRCADGSTPGAHHDCAPRDDDALIEPLQAFTDALLAAKPDPRKLLVAAIAGDPAPVGVVTTELGPALAPSCTFADGVASAQPAVRLASFIDTFPGGHQRASICSTGAVAEVAAATRRLIGDPCLDSRQLIDTSSADGMQPACEVIQMRDPGFTAHPLTVPRCEDAPPQPCYRLVSDPDTCPAGDDHLRILLRGNFQPDAWIHVRCQHPQ